MTRRWFNCLPAALCAALLLGIPTSQALEDPWPLIQRVGGALSVDPRLVAAIVYAESRFNPDARSPKGALGLMQLLPYQGARDAYRYLFNQEGVPTDQALLDPEINVWLGTAYLKLLLEQHYGSLPRDAAEILAIASYVWGPDNVRRSLVERHGVPDSRERALQLVATAPTEVSSYVQQVSRLRAKGGVR